MMVRLSPEMGAAIQNASEGHETLCENSRVVGFGMRTNRLYDFSEYPV